eukprot:scaffold878_cov271-Pinguiococcus_pyrenoidosus.AAC.16
MQQQHSHPNQLGKESLIGVASSSSEIMAEIKDIKGRIEELVETRRVQVRLLATQIVLVHLVAFKRSAICSHTSVVFPREGL